MAGRHVAQIVTDAVVYSLPDGEGDEFFGLLYGRGQWLFANHMLAGLERILGQGKMLRVGRANVDCIDRRITQDFAVVGRNCGDGKACTDALCRSRFLPVIAAASTDSSRRTASRCTRPMKPVPKIAVLIGFITRRYLGRQAEILQKL